MADGIDSHSMRFSSATTTWKLAVYASVVLWLATIAGNVALFAVHPGSHWPMLETAEALQVASLIPVALLVHTFIKRSRLSRPLTALGVLSILAGAGIDIAFATGAASFGDGLIGGPLFAVVEVTLLAWLLAANWLAWRLGTLPLSIALLGISSAITATLLYPVWAIGLSRVLRT
jgi:hypothetical protein